MKFMPYVMQHIKRGTLQAKLILSLVFEVLVFLSFKILMTPHLSKLIKAFKFYNWKSVFFCFCFLFLNGCQILLWHRSTLKVYNMDLSVILGFCTELLTFWGFWTQITMPNFRRNVGDTYQITFLFVFFFPKWRPNIIKFNNRGVDNLPFLNCLTDSISCLFSLCLCNVTSCWTFLPNFLSSLNFFAFSDLSSDSCLAISFSLTWKKLWRRML